ncbi:rifin, partial [Plasmodium reichenowi]
VYGKNKPSITQRLIPIYTSRVLSESDTESSVYDNDEEINSVKEIFDRQTSQRFEEYEERMKEKRQKRKEQRDKNIQKIIEKDKMEKSLAEKIEKGCLMCGCGLGSVAGSVGLFGGIAVNVWKPGALKAAIASALKANNANILATAEAAGEAAGAAEIMKLIKSTYTVDELGGTVLKSFFDARKYNDASVIARAVYEQYFTKCAYDSSGNLLRHFTYGNRHIPICNSVLKQTEAVSRSGQHLSEMKGIKTAVEIMVSEAKGAAAKATKIATDHETALIEARETGVINTIFMSKQTAIIASIVAILIIVLIMIIIYLILRYRRKKKMKKKAQYTKLLNE